MSACPKLSMTSVMDVKLKLIYSDISSAEFCHFLQGATFSPRLGTGN